MAHTMDKMPLVELLRQVSQTKATLKLLGKDGVEAITGLAEAVAVSVNASSPRPLSDPSGYKAYDAFTLLLFFECRGLTQSEYLSKAMDLSTRLSRPLVNVSVLDRKDLLDYWAGTSETYAGKAVEIAQATAGRDDTLADDMDILPDATPSATVKTTPSYLPSTLSTSDKLFCANVKARERTLRTSTSVLLAKTTRSFDVVRGLMTEHFKGVPSGASAGAKKGAPLDTSLPVKKKHKTDVAAAPRKPAAPATKQPTGAAPSPSRPKKPSGLPIIIIPNAVQSLITLYNAKDLLQDQKFIASDTRRNAGADKPSKIEISRDPAKLPSGVPSKYLIVDSVDSLSSQDWYVISYFS